MGNDGPMRGWTQLEKVDERWYVLEEYTHSHYSPLIPRYQVTTLLYPIPYQ